MTRGRDAPPMHLIVNPTSANGRLARYWPRLLQAMEGARVPFTFEFTEAPGHATELARGARLRGVPTIVSVGGDGTVHEVVNGLVGEEALPFLPGGALPMLGVIPFGTGTDFVRTTGIPRDPLEAIQRLQRGQPRCVDLIEVRYQHEGQPRRRYCANVVGLGFDAAIVKRVNRSFKALRGTIPFISSLLVELFGYQNKQVAVRFNGQELSGKVNAVVACNGRYFGGGMEVGPTACPDDGLIDLVIIGDLNRLELLLNLPRIYAGTHLTHPKVRHFQVTEAEVETDEDVFVEAEGELLGRAPVHLRIIPRALWVIA